MDVALVAAPTTLEGAVVTGYSVERRDLPAATPGVDGRTRDASSAKASINGAIGGVPATAQSRPMRMPNPVPSIRRPREPFNTEAYDHLEENPFRAVSVAPDHTCAQRTLQERFFLRSQ